MPISESYCNTGKFYRKEMKRSLTRRAAAFDRYGPASLRSALPRSLRRRLERYGREVRQEGERSDTHLRPHKAPIMLTEWIPMTYFDI